MISTLDPIEKRWSKLKKAMTSLQWTSGGILTGAIDLICLSQISVISKIILFTPSSAA